MSLTANRILLRRATLVDPNQVRNGDLAEFEVCVAAAMHQAEGDGATIRFRTMRFPKISFGASSQSLRARHLF